MFVSVVLVWSTWSFMQMTSSPEDTPPTPPEVSDNLPAGPQEAANPGRSNPIAIARNSLLSGDYEKVLTDLGDLAMSDTHRLEAYGLLALTEFLRGRSDDAMDALEHILREPSPTTDDTWPTLLAKHWLQNRTSEASWTGLRMRHPEDPIIELAYVSTLSTSQTLETSLSNLGMLKRFQERQSLQS